MLEYHWTASSGPVDHYNVYLSTNDTSFEWIDTTADATPTYTYTNAQDGFRYQLQVEPVDATGQVGPMSLPSEATTVQLPVELHLAEGWNLISFPSAICYYGETQPAVAMPSGIEYVDVTTLGHATMADWFSSVLTVHNPAVTPAWLTVQSFDSLGGHIMDSSLPSTFHTLDYMSGGYGYWVKLNPGTGGGTLRFPGNRLAEDTTLLLQAGWNLIGYLPRRGYHDTATPPQEQLLYTRDNDWEQTPIPVVEVLLSDIIGNLSYLLSMRPGGSNEGYAPSEPVGLPILHDMSPGAGYWVDVTEGTNFAYSQSSPMTAPAKTDASHTGIAFSTPQASFLYGQAMYDGVFASPGTEVVVRLADGRVVGQTTVEREGQYGALAVYGDEPSTPHKDGAVTGEWLSVYLNGILARQVQWPGANEAHLLDVSAMSTPQESWLGQNFPNPFNPETWIPYALDQDTNVQIRIFDLTGHLVRQLNLGAQQTGWYDTTDKAAYWDGTNSLGEPVASGVYVYQLATRTNEYIRRMIVLK